MSVLTDPDLDLAGLDPDVAYPANPSVPDSDLHAVVRFLSYGSLRGHFDGRPDCFVGQDLSVYYRRGERTFVGPDVLVSFGVDPAQIRKAASYRPWDAGGPPAFVLEIASERTYEKDLHVKPAVYLEVGVEEYWRFDPTGGEFFAFSPFLQGDRREGDALVPIEVGADGDGRLRGHSRVLGLDLHAEPSRLRFRDPLSGLWLPDPDEALRQRDAAEVRATAAEARAAAAEAELVALRARRDAQP
ncbi:MAG: Uma2 family endonuclease [Acidimicrobiia bacterium]|nr:Uma2 family endonuclease [Acidimicrobiia bacterium]MYB24274.1 Uma2 family endonuclease [Acidimicrobiia bacterium]